MNSFIQRYVQKCKESSVEPLKSILELTEGIDDLDLGEVTLGSKNAICLGFALEKFDIFRVINLSESYMGDEGASFLCRSIMKKRRLEELNLSGANIDSSGSVSIGQLLKTNRSIKVLSLEWNTLGTLESGLKHISNGLKSNSVLETLDLRNNRITAEGSLKLSQALLKNSSLKKLDLRWNSIGTTGAEYIRQVLEKENTTVTQILLSGNEVDFETQESLRRILERNRDFEHQSMRKKKIEEEEGEFEEEVILTTSTNELTTTDNEEEEEIDRKIMENMKEISKMKDSLRHGALELNDLRGKLHDKDLETSGVRQETRTLKSTLEHSRLMHEQETRKLNDELNHLKLMKTETENLLEKKTRELAEISIKHSEFKTENDRLHETSKILRERAEKAESGLRETRSRLDIAERDSVRFKRELEVCKEEVNGLEGEAERSKELEEQLRAERTENVRLRDEYDRTVRKMERQKAQEIEELKNLHQERIHGMEEKQRKTDDILEETKNVMDDWKARAGRLEVQIGKAREDHKRSIESLSIQKSAGDNECAGLKLEVKQLKFNITQQQIQSRQTQKKYEREMYKLNEKLEELVDIQEKDKQINELRILEKVKENESLEKEVKRITYLLTTIKEKYEESNRKMEADIVKYVKRAFSSQN